MFEGHAGYTDIEQRYIPSSCRSAHTMKNQSFSRRLTFALAGLRSAWRSEASFKAQVGAAAAVLIALLVPQPSPLWWAIFAVTVAFVLAAELFNTAIETLADHLHPAQDPAIKVVKDCAAGAVLVASVAALAVARRSPTTCCYADALSGADRPCSRRQFRRPREVLRTSRVSLARRAAS